MGLAIFGGVFAFLLVGAIVGELVVQTAKPNQLGCLDWWRLRGVYGRR